MQFHVNKRKRNGLVKLYVTRGNAKRKPEQKTDENEEKQCDKKIDKLNKCNNKF